MLMPKKNRIAIYELLFKEGVMVAKKDVHLAKHPELADKNVPNLHVMKAMQVRSCFVRDSDPVHTSIAGKSLVSLESVVQNAEHVCDREIVLKVIYSRTVTVGNTNNITFYLFDYCNINS